VAQKPEERRGNEIILVVMVEGRGGIGW